jgi:hypothetical protein
MWDESKRNGLFAAGSDTDPATSTLRKTKEEVAGILASNRKVI